MSLVDEARYYEGYLADNSSQDHQDWGRGLKEGMGGRWEGCAKGGATHHMFT